MDEIAERAKLALLDLTDDVIELIIERKRKAFTKKQEDAVAVVVPVVDEIPDVEEPTYYPPPVVEPEPVPLPPPPSPVIPEPPMDRSVEPISRRGLPWLRRR